MSMNIEDILALLAVSGNTKSGNKTDLSTLLSPELGIFSGTFQQQADPRLDEDFIRQRNMPITNEILNSGRTDTVRAQILSMVQEGASEPEINQWIDLNANDFYSKNPTDIPETTADLKSLAKTLKSEQFKFSNELSDARISAASQSPFAKAGLPEPGSRYAIPEEPFMAADLMAKSAAEGYKKRLAEIEKNRLLQEQAGSRPSKAAGYREAGFTDLQQREAELRQEMARALQPGTPNVRSTTEIAKDMEALQKERRAGEPSKENVSLLARLGRGAAKAVIGQVGGPLLGPLVGSWIGADKPTDGKTTPKGKDAAPKQTMEELRLRRNLNPDFQQRKMNEVNKLLAERYQKQADTQGTGDPLVDALIRRAYVNRLMNG